MWLLRSNSCNQAPRTATVLRCRTTCVFEGAICITQIQDRFRDRPGIGRRLDTADMLFKILLRDSIEGKRGNRSFKVWSGDRPGAM